MLEAFVIKEPKAYCSNELYTFLKNPDARYSAFSNDDVNNDTKVLILGDSYINSYIQDDLAESFHQTIMIRKNHVSNLYHILEVYKPDIVICEAAEREDNFSAYISAEKNIKNHFYVINTDVLFYSEEGGAPQYMISGFSDQETYGTWTNGTEAEISFIICEKEQDIENIEPICNRKLRAEINLGGVYNHHQDVEILINEKSVYHKSLTDSDTAICFDFDTDNNITTDIKIKIPNAISPSANGGSDTRSLGLFIKDIKINKCLNP